MGSTFGMIAAADGFSVVHKRLSEATISDTAMPAPRRLHNWRNGPIRQAADHGRDDEVVRKLIRTNAQGEKTRRCRDKKARAALDQRA